VSVRVCVCVCVCTCVCVRVCVEYTHTHTHTCTHKHTHTHPRTHTSKGIYIHTPTRMHIYTHIHVRAQTQLQTRTKTHNVLQTAASNSCILEFVICRRSSARKFVLKCVWSSVFSSSSSSEIQYYQLVPFAQNVAWKGRSILRLVERIQILVFIWKRVLPTSYHHLRETLCWPRGSKYARLDAVYLKNTKRSVFPQQRFAARRSEFEKHNTLRLVERI